MCHILPRSLTLSASLLLLAALPLGAALPVPESIPGLAPMQQKAIPAKKLRGYGTVEGKFAEYVAADKNRVSILRITCDDTSHAALTLGKYLSDLRCLGGVSDAAVTVAGKRVPVLAVEGQGSVAALRHEKQVAIVAAQQMRNLTAVLAALDLEKQSNLDFRGSDVPMYLDRYDKYGWHFYFDPWSKPEGQANYDLDRSFKYMAEKRMGMLIPLSLNNIDSTEAVIEYANLAWAIERGRELSVPTFIQAWAIGAPRLLVNRFPYDTMLKMPQFVGNCYGPGENGGGYPPEVAWSSEKAEDVLLSWIQPIYRRYAKYPNVTGYAEPHGEIEHGTSMIFTDYGPVADAAYRPFLEEKYKTPQAVDKRWWGGRGTIKTWDDVRLPEVADFLGWNKDALDIGGKWRFACDKDLAKEALADWAKPTLDDKSWPEMVAPGDDRPRFRNQDKEMRVPAVFRRSFLLTESQLNDLRKQGQGKVYLYAWTLARADRPIEAAINGTKVGQYTPPGNALAWCVFEVSGALRAGDNLLALHLPWSEIAYRIYLSPTAPRRYPDLGTEMNSRWVDFRDFAVWTRYQQVRKGVETIRREDPDKYIKLMAPGGMIEQSKALAEDFGGTFHDTGSMSGWWIDYQPALMRSSGLPFTIEPGNGAPNLPELKRFTGHWMTEGVNAIDYFMNLGQILWDPAQKKWFEANLPLAHLVGKYHAPPAQVAVMYSGRTDRLGSFPWDGFQGEDFGLPGVLWVRMQLENQIPFPRDVLLDSDFLRGNADKYRVIIDGGTVIMEDTLVSRIEQWVREGGIFVAYGQTGRHTPEVKDAWPLARVSGYRIRTSGRNGQISTVPGQKVFAGEGWAKPVNANGRTLEPVADDCQPLLAWQDGTPAVGMRKIGKGCMITMPTAVRGMLNDVLRWSGHYNENPTAADCRPIEYVSNNGLYRIFVLWADRVKTPSTTSLKIPGDSAPTALRNIVTGAMMTGTASPGGVSFEGIAVDRNDVYAYLAPRREITTASLDWFNLQRDWWQGTVKPRPAPTVPAVKNTLPMDEDWAFSPVSDDAPDGRTLVGPGVNDKDWKRIDLGIWNVQGFPNAKHGVFRKEVTIPAAWKSGRTWVWLAGSGDTLRPPYKAKFYIDGQLQWTSGNSQYSMMSLDLTDKLAPGRHLLAWDIEGTGKFDGVSGDMWIEFVPDPVFTQSLAGVWSSGITLPGRATATGAKQTFVPDPRGKDLLVQFYIDGKRADLQSIYINNQNVYFYGGPRGQHRRMTLNPWLKWGEKNEIELKFYYNEPMDISTIELRYYRPDQL